MSVGLEELPASEFPPSQAESLPPPMSIDTAMELVQDEGLPKPISIEEAHKLTPQTPQDLLQKDIEELRGGRARGGTTMYADDPAKYLPVADKVIEGIQTGGIAASHDRFNEGSADRNDIYRLANFIVEQENRGDESGLESVGKLVAKLPGFGVEFAATGGTYALARKGVQAAATKALGRFAASTAGRAATAIGSRAAGVGAFAAANPWMVFNSTQQARLKRVVNKEDDPGFVGAMPAGFLDTSIELGSELAGGRLIQGLGAVARGTQRGLRGTVAPLIDKLPGGNAVKALKAGILGRWMGATSKGIRHAIAKVSRPDGWGQVLKDIGFHGPVGEMLEERAGEIGRGLSSAAGVKGLQDDFGVTGGLLSGNPEALNQLLIEGAAFSIPGFTNLIGQSVADMAQGKPPQIGQDVYAGLATAFQPNEQDRQNGLPWFKRLFWEQTPPESVPGGPASAQESTTGQLATEAPQTQDAAETLPMAADGNQTPDSIYSARPGDAVTQITAEEHVDSSQGVVEGLPPEVPVPEGVESGPAEVVPVAEEAAPQPVTFDLPPTEATVGREFLVEPNQPPGVGKLSLDEAAVSAQFPGAKTERTGTDSWRVTLPSGLTTDIVGVPNIHPKPEVMDSLRKRYAQQFTDEQWSKMQAAGYYEIVSRDGERIPVASLIALSRYAGADSQVLRHEALHWAKALGLFTDKEWLALAGRYAKGVTDAKAIEEAIATGLQRKGAPQTVWQRVKEFFQKLLKAFGIGDLDARTVERLMDDPQFWAREPIGEERGAAALFSDDPEVQRKLANIAKTPRERDFLAELDRAATEAGEPGQRRDAEVFDAAQQRLQADAQGERDKILRRASEGGQLDDTETVIAKELFQDEAYSALESGDEAKIAEVKKLRDAYRATGTAQARAFRMRHDPLNDKSVHEATPQERTTLLLDEIYKLPPKQEKQRQKAEASGDKEALDKLDRQWAARLAKINRYLNSLGLSLEELPKIADDPIATAKVQKQLSAANAGFWDKLYEYWQQSLLSGPTTQAVNITGNLASGVWDYLIQRPVEALTNIGGYDATGARVGELPYIWKGMARGISEGMRTALVTWHSESPVTKRDKWDQTNTAIGGKTGRFVRAFGWRPLQVADEFFNALFSNLEVGARAYRLAKLQVKSGPALSQFIDSEIANRDSLSWRMARNHAAELTFQQEVDGLPKKLKQIGMTVKGTIGLRWLLPFVSFPVHSATIALRKAPITGDLAAMRAAYKNWQEGRPITFGMNRRVAERFIAWGALVALASTIDPDDPWITGSKTAPQGYPKNSIRIAGKWYNYGRVEPFATTLGLMVDGITTTRTGSTEEMVSVPVKLTVAQISDKTFLRGLADAMTAFGIVYSPAAQEERALERVSQWGARFTESFVPNIYRQTVEATRPQQAEYRMWGRTSAERLARLGERLAEGVEIPGVQHEMRYGAFGDPIRKGESPLYFGPQSDFLFRLLSPVQVTKAEQRALGYRLAAQWNNSHPDQPQVVFGRVEPYFTWRKEKHSLTGPEYEEYQKLAGELSDKYVNARLGKVKEPTPQNIEALKKAVSDGREAARNRLKSKWIERIQVDSASAAK